MTGIFLIAFHFFFETEVLPEPEIHYFSYTGWPVCACLCPLRAGLTSTYHYIPLRFIMWVLGIQIQVLIFEQQVLYPLIFLAPNYFCVSM